MDTPVGFYAVKTSAIFLISMSYFVFGSIMSLSVNAAMKDIDEKELSKISTWLLLVEIMCIFGVLGLGFYIIRVFVKNIPFPLEGVFGYNHSRLKEAAGGVIIAYIIFTYQTKLNAKLVELKKRLHL